MGQYISKGILKKLTFFLLVFCLMFSQLPAFAATDKGPGAVGEVDFDYINDVVDMINENYNGQVDEEQMLNSALKGVFGTMDPYTTFYTPAEAESFMSTINGTFTGIGIAMSEMKDSVLISKVYAESPAEEAGVLQGDRIASVDGKDVAGAPLEEVYFLIAGEAGTKVKLGIIRTGQNGILYFEMARGAVPLNPVTYEIKDGIGYIKLDMFNGHTDNYITQALKEMDDKKITKIVLDLRDNPGGEVVQAVWLARKFVPAGVITKLDYKSEQYEDEIYESGLEAPRYRLAVLVNGMSASASEIFAGAVQDTAAGTLIGTKTFGKAKVQNMFPILTPEASEKYRKQLGVRIADGVRLRDEYGITPKEDEIIGYTKMTTGLYYTPDGRMIDGTGITPDIVVKDTPPVSDIAPGAIQKLSATFKPGLNDGGQDVYNAEKILKILGYDVDAPDILLDEKTFKAVAQFQKDVKLYSYGVLDFTTQKALNQALDGIILKYDMQYAKALEVLNK